MEQINVTLVSGALAWAFNLMLSWQKDSLKIWYDYLITDRKIASASISLPMINLKLSFLLNRDLRCTSILLRLRWQFRHKYFQSNPSSYRNTELDLEKSCTELHLFEQAALPGYYLYIIQDELLKGGPVIAPTDQPQQVRACSLTTARSNSILPNLLSLYR